MVFVVNNWPLFLVSNADNNLVISSGDIIDGYIVLGFCFSLFYYLGYSHIEKKLWEKDLLTVQEVRPRPFGACFYGSVAVLNGAGSIFSFVTGNAVLSIALFMGAALFGFFLFNILRTNIKYDADTLIIRNGKTVQEVPATSIRRIQWNYVRGTTGPSLVIYLWDGSKIVLHHMDYVGLRKMAEFFCLKFGEKSDDLE